jgi:hypothetical protein
VSERAKGFLYDNTKAARMLSEGLHRASAERATSLREIGRRLNYRQAVVLSHMATGRVPIPIDRALDFARELHLPPREFLLAVLEQRHEKIDWRLLSGDPDPEDFHFELAGIAGRRLDDLSTEHRRVLREVVNEPSPARRWLSVAELGAIDLLREMRPRLSADGLTAQDRRAIRAALSSVD